MVKTENNHIVIDEAGSALVAGTRFSVDSIARAILENDWTAEDFCRNHRGEITLAQIYAALSFYYDHADSGTAKRENILNAIRNHRDELRRFGVRRLGLFGSCVRGDADQASDIDLLVDLKDASINSYMDVKCFLEQLFNRKVDLVLTHALRKELRDSVMKEVVYAEGF